MSDIFPCTYQPFGLQILKIVCLLHLSIWGLDASLGFCGCCSSYTLDINFYRTNIGKDFFPDFVGCLYSANSSLPEQKLFNFVQSHFFQFLLLFPELLGTFSESCCSCQYLRVFFVNNFKVPCLTLGT